MIDYMSTADFAAKVEWEGGVEGALEYGLKHTDLDPGDESVAELRAKWRELEEIYGELEALSDEAARILDEIQDGAE